MWQRIQTLWLLLAGVAMTLTFLFPILSIAGVPTLEGNDILEMTSLWLKSTYNNTFADIHWGLFALTSLIVLLSFFTIFIFKKRTLQMRICIFNLLLVLGQLAYFSFLGFQYKEKGTELIFHPLPALLPIATITLLILAYRGVRKDHILIRISNRIR